MGQGPHQHRLGGAVPAGDGAHLKQFQGIHKTGELLKAVVAHIKIGKTLDEDIADIAYRGPPLVIGGLVGNGLDSGFDGGQGHPVLPGHRGEGGGLLRGGLLGQHL